MSLSTHKLAAWLTAVIAAVLMMPASNASASIFQLADRDRSQTIDFFDVAAQLSYLGDVNRDDSVDAEDVTVFTKLVSIFTDRIPAGDESAAQQSRPLGSIFIAVSPASAPTTSSSSSQVAQANPARHDVQSTPNIGFPLITADDRVSTMHMLTRTLRGPPLA
ncbi:MAG: hypothetical protein AAGB34_08180 [Planctomycetota bacterium]